MVGLHVRMRQLYQPEELIEPWSRIRRRYHQILVASVHDKRKVHSSKKPRSIEDYKEEFFLPQ